MGVADLARTHLGPVARNLLEGAGIEFYRPNRLDVAQCTTLPITLVFLPAADIASYVGEGNVDIGITGIDVVAEAQVDVDNLLDLGFGKCKLALQAPSTSNYTDPKQLAGHRIVTSFPNLTKKFFGRTIFRNQINTPDSVSR